MAPARRRRSLFGLAFGSVLIGAADAPADTTARPEPIETYFVRNAGADTLPHLQRVLPALLDVDCGPAFTRALDFVLDGLRAAVGVGTGPRSVAPGRWGGTGQ